MREVGPRARAGGVRLRCARMLLMHDRGGGVVRGIDGGGVVRGMDGGGVCRGMGGVACRRRAGRVVVCFVAADLGTVLASGCDGGSFANVL